MISTKETTTKVLIPTRIGAATRAKPTCIAQAEKTPEDSKRASTYYREVCIPAWNDKWEALNDEIDERYDWLESERERIEKREDEQTKR